MLQLVTELTTQLARDGWSRRFLHSGQLTLAEFTRPLGGGVAAATRIERVSWRPRQSTVEIAVRLGYGYEPATALMPVLTLSADPMLVVEENESTDPMWQIRPGRPVEVRTCADSIAAAVQSYALSLATPPVNVPTLIAALSDAGRTSVHRRAELLPVLLASMGRMQDARALVTDDSSADVDTRQHRRFLRQFSRWLDAGSPTIPPVEQTLDLLPKPRATSPDALIERARREAKARHAAMRAVRSKSKGKSEAELAAMLTKEYQNSGLPIAPSAVTLNAQLLASGRRPFRRSRTGLHAAATIGRIGRDVVSEMQLRRPEPTWLIPPERACYPLPVGARDWVAVDLAPDAREWLLAAGVAATQRLGPLTRVLVWLSRDVKPESPHDESGLLVHLGAHEVGTLPAVITGELQPYLSAADFYDEDIWTDARLTGVQSGLPLLLEVRLPMSD